MDKIEELKAEQAKIAAELAKELAKMEGNQVPTETSPATNGTVNNKESITAKTDRNGKTAYQRILERGPAYKDISPDNDFFEMVEVLLSTPIKYMSKRQSYNERKGIKTHWYDWPSYLDAKDMNQEQYEALLVEWQGPYQEDVPVPVPPVKPVEILDNVTQEPVSKPFNGHSLSPSDLNRWEQIQLERIKNGTYTEKYKSRN
jgi:hypothetical protein